MRLGRRHGEVGVVDAGGFRFGRTTGERRPRDLNGLCARGRAVGHRG